MLLRVYVVMGEPSKILNAHEATTLGMDILLWRAQEETRNEIRPDGIAAPKKRSAEELKRMVETWLQYGELSIVSKRQTSLNYAYGKRARTDVEPPWMITMTMSDAKVDPSIRICSSFGKLVGQLVLGFEKRDAPMHIQRRMQRRFLEPRETETRKMHSLEEYGLMHVKLYEDISQHGAIATSYAYPVKVEGRYVMDPSPIPKFDNPKLEMAAIQLFGAGREQRIYALPPYTKVVSLDFEDYPFVATKADHVCDMCDASDSYLDEVILDDQGNRMFVCSDTDYCTGRQQAGHVGALGTTNAEDAA